MIRRGRVACAYYEPLKGLLYVLEDTQETPHFDLTRMREHFRVLVGSLTCECVIQFLNKPIQILYYQAPNPMMFS